MVQNLTTKPKAILFDWDNTLVDTWPIIFKGLEETFSKMGHKAWSMDEVKAKVGGSLREHFPKVFGNDWEAAGEIYLKFYRSNNLKFLKAYDESKTLLNVIKNNNIRMSVVSNKTAATLRQEVEHLGYSHYFEAIIGAGDAAKDKPEPDSILHALKLMDLEPSKDILYVGDASVDVLASNAAGLTSVLFNKGYVEQELLNQASHVFTELTTFTEKLKTYA